MLLTRVGHTAPVLEMVLQGEKLDGYRWVGWRKRGSGGERLVQQWGLRQGD